jgi:hypothetical protein
MEAWSDDIDLNFRCFPGDLILVRCAALRAHPNGLVPANANVFLNVLGSDDGVFTEHVGTDVVVCTVIGSIEFSGAEELDYLVLMTSAGIAYVFDDPQNGYWLPAGGINDTIKLDYCDGLTVEAPFVVVEKASEAAWLDRGKWQPSWWTFERTLPHPYVQR